MEWMTFLNASTHGKTKQPLEFYPGIALLVATKDRYRYTYLLLLRFVGKTESFITVPARQRSQRSCLVYPKIFGQ